MGTQKNDPPIGVNEAIVCGQLVAEPEMREMPSGSSAASFSLTVRRVGEKTTSVPVTWFDPPARLASWSVGDMIVCRGPVVRRFYQTGGGVGSATEVTVREAHLARHPRTAQKVVQKTATELSGLIDRLG